MDGWMDRRVQHLKKNCSKHTAEEDRLTERREGFVFICPRMNSLNVVLTDPAPQNQVSFFLLWTPQYRALRAPRWTGFISESCDCLGLEKLELEQLL